MSLRIPENLRTASFNPKFMVLIKNVVVKTSQLFGPGSTFVSVSFFAFLRKIFSQSDIKPAKINEWSI